jgi:hypothetical protein
VDSDSASLRRSITLQLDADASPKWETVTEKNRGVWREILSHPKTLEALGLTPAAAPGPPSPGLPAGAVGAFYDGLARLHALVASKIFKVEFSPTLQLVAYTEKEKEQLIPVTQALADKYAPILLEKYGGELVLAFLLFSMTAHKMEAVRALARKAAETPGAREPENGSQLKEAVQ